MSDDTANRPVDELKVIVAVLNANPVHTRLTIFTNSKRYGHVADTNGESGVLTVDTELAGEFVTRLKPVAVIWQPEDNQPPPDWLREPAWLLSGENPYTKRFVRSQSE